MHSDLGEFELIQRFFQTRAMAALAQDNQHILLGIGDDCALIEPNPQEHIAITSDMLVEGRHFFADANPQWLGHKALAVNLSDLAAMGAKPLGFTLAVALPHANSAWLNAFSNGLFALAQEFSCPLIGGDTTRGPLNICITAFGSIPTGKAIRRSGAIVGDDIWVSGSVGDARLALAALRQELTLSNLELQTIQASLHQPTPRINLGMALRDLAHSAVDISDGLFGDLKHILEASQVDAQVFLEQLPKSAILKKQERAIQNQFAANGGDDYELCFTAPADKHDQIRELGKALSLNLTRIGSITAMTSLTPKLQIFDEQQTLLSDTETAPFLKSFDHFK